jgi:hypothetical protein
MVLFLRSAGYGRRGSRTHNKVCLERKMLIMDNFYSTHTEYICKSLWNGIKYYPKLTHSDPLTTYEYYIVNAICKNKYQT